MFCVCVPVFVFNWHAEFALTTLRIDAEIARHGVKFSVYTAFGQPALFGYKMVRKVLHAQNIARPLVVMAVIGGLVNLGIGYFLTYHTSMGFYGAACALMTVNLVHCVAYFAYTREIHHIDGGG